MKYNFKITYFEIKGGRSGPTVNKEFVSRAEVKRYIIMRAHTIAALLVQDLNINKDISSEFKPYLK